MTTTTKPDQPGGDKPIVLLGAGGHARVLQSLLNMQQRQIAAVLDDDPSLHGKRIGQTGLEILGGLNQVTRYHPNEVELVNAIGSAHRPTTRQAIYEKHTQAGYTFATLIHPAATVAPEADLAQGVQIMAGAIVQAQACISDNVLINTNASVDHDTTIGPHSHIAPGVTICGNVTIGKGCHIGAGATVIQGIAVGSGALLGAGATVLKDVTQGQTVVGTPAKVV